MNVFDNEMLQEILDLVVVKLKCTEKKVYFNSLFRESSLPNFHWSRYFSRKGKILTFKQSKINGQLYSQSLPIDILIESDFLGHFWVVKGETEAPISKSPWKQSLNTFIWASCQSSEFAKFYADLSFIKTYHGDF